MLDVALKYKDELQNLFINTFHKDKYKFYHYNSYYSELQLKEDTWNAHEFVSVDKQGNVIGFINYEINRVATSVCGLGIINFSDNKFTFGKDVMQAIRDVFEKYNFRKISFCVVIGNPIEKTYDKLVAKYGGRIVGIEKEHTVLYDHKFYDVKRYEILREDYIKSKENNDDNT